MKQLSLSECLDCSNCEFSIGSVNEKSGRAEIILHCSMMEECLNEMIDEENSEE